MGVGVIWLVGGEAGGLIGVLLTLFGLIGMMFVLTGYRQDKIGEKFQSEGILTQTERSLLSLLSVQALHLPTSKVCHAWIYISFALIVLSGKSSNI